MPNYKLVITKEADKDLNHIYVDGFKRWGEAQADEYYSGLLDHFDMLCENPYLYQAINEIREDYRRSICGKHSIFYRLIDDAVEIVGLIKHENRFY